MRRSAPLAFVLFVALALAIATPRRAAAGPFEVADTSWEGGSELYAIAERELGPERVKAVATLDWSVLKPDDGVLILHPTESVDAGEASDFMKAGGRLAVLDDFGKGDEVLHRFKIERAPMPDRPAVMLRNNPNLPIAEPYIDPQHPQNAPHPIVSSVKRLVLNHPTALVHPDLSSVLKVRALGEPDAIVAVAGQVGSGRLFAMGDPSAVINEMLRYPGNRAFAAGLVRYLANGDEHSQSRLFILTNKFSEQGTVGGDKTIVKDIEQFLQSLADGLAQARHNGLPKWVFIVLAALMIASIAIWVARSSGRPYRNPTPRYARPTPLVARGGVAGRFAHLAAPTSAKALVLLELKSGVTEVLAERFGLGPEPSMEVLVKKVRATRALPDDVVDEFDRLLRLMQRAEAVIVAGGQLQMRISREMVNRASRVVERVLDATADVSPPASPVGLSPVAEPGLGNGQSTS